MKSPYIIECFAGRQLYGDEFSLEDIKRWHDEEAEEYADLGNRNKSEYRYDYHALNVHHGYRFLGRVGRFPNVLGLGSAWGFEFLPIIDRISALTIIEPSDHMISEKLGQIVPRYVKPSIDGTIGFSANTFDLITAFGVLHHIPNVTHVFGELARVLKPGGFLLSREPIVSQGDWRFPRKGITKNERGIPAPLFERMIEDNGLHVVNKAFCFCGTSFLTRIGKRIFPDAVLYSNHYYIVMDKYISLLMSWNRKYHPLGLAKRCAPDSVFYLVKK